MADTARGSVSVTPVVTVTADADSDAVDVIHHDIKSALGGKLEYVKANDDDKWVYSASLDVATGNADLIAAGTSFTEGGTTTTSDHVKFLYLHNSGTTNGTTATASKVYLTLDGGDPNAQLDTLEIGANESIVLKFKDGLNAANVHSATSSGTVRCTICAILDDVA